MSRKQIIAILMLSPHYFGLSLEQRLEIINRLTAQPCAPPPLALTTA